MIPARISTSLCLALLLSAPLAAAAETKLEKPAAETAPGHSESGNVTIVDVSKEGADVDKLVQSGHTTIVDVFSEACPPCRMISPKLDAFVSKKTGFKVIKLDIGTEQTDEGRHINWKAPIVGQLAIRSIPYFMVYGEDGKLQAKGDDAYEKVIGWLKEEKLLK